MQGNMSMKAYKELNKIRTKHEVAEGKKHMKTLLLWRTFWFRQRLPHQHQGAYPLVDQKTQEQDRQDKTRQDRQDRTNRED